MSIFVHLPKLPDLLQKIYSDCDLNKLNLAINEAGYPPSSSVHIPLIYWMLCTGYCNHFLEIGTFTGVIPVVMSRLFPALNIHTVDIPLDDKRNSTQYARSPALREKLQRVRDYLDKVENITFTNKSSQLLWQNYNDMDNFDLTWVDGDHYGFTPYNDILFSLHKLNPNGVVLCDDVFLNKDDPTMNALDQISTDIPIKVYAIQKREDDSSKFIVCVIPDRADSSRHGLSDQVLKLL